MQNFKREHPEIIERLRSTRIGDAIRTDVSTNYSSVSNSKEIGINCIRVNINTNADQHHIVSQSSSTPQASIENLRREEPNIINDEPISVVRSSNELLNTMMNGINYSIEGNENDYGTENEKSERVNNMSPEFDTTMIDRLESPESERIHHFHTDDEKNNNDLNLSITAHDTDTVQLHSSSSDIAEALTQILEEGSDDKSQRSTDMSTDDEELIKETIEEINEHIISGLDSVDDIFLTPPIAFRDS